jgi:hypothetical protein
LGYHKDERFLLVFCIASLILFFIFFFAYQSLLAPYLAKARASGRGIRAIFIVGGANDMKTCFDHCEKWREADYPKSVDGWFREKDTFVNALSVELGCPAIYTSASSARRQRLMEAKSNIRLGYQGRLEEAEKEVMFAQCMARIFMLLGEKSTEGQWPSFGPGVYHLQKPALSTTLCDPWGHPGLEELYPHELWGSSCTTSSWEAFRRPACFSRLR